MTPRPSLARALTIAVVSAFSPLASQSPVLVDALGPSVDARGVHAGAIGDLDRDGTPDIGIGLPLADGGHGRLIVRSGRDGRVLHDLRGFAGMQLGSSFAGIADVDRDGVDDFVVGMMRATANGLRSGAVRVCSGASGRGITTLWGDGEGDLFGIVCASIGDVDRDSVPDFAVGAPENGAPVGFYGAGYARVFSGRDLAVLHTFDGVNSADEFGSAIADAGDYDGDGHDDVAVCAFLEPSGIGVGSITVFSGRTGAVLERWHGERNSDHFGISVRNLGDVDGDGVGDLAMGAVNIWNAGLDGSVQIRSMRTGELLHTIRGPLGGGMFGFSIAPAGDVDGDGAADLWIGDPMHAFGSVRSGGAWLYSGRTATRLATLAGSAPGAFYGAVGTVGDLDHDGVPEVAVTAGADDLGGVTQGVVRVLTTANAVSTFGSGCGRAAVAPRLDASAAQVGRPWSVFVAHAPTPAVGALVASPVPALPMPIGGGCALYVTPAVVGTVASFTTDVAGRWSSVWTLPADPALAGTRLAFQALFASAHGPAATQGVYLTVQR